MTAQQRGALRAFVVTPALVVAVVGGVLVASGLVYAAVFAVHGGAWGGPTSLRKPILFGLSTGVTLWSVGWVIAALPRRRIDGPLYAALAVGLLIEVGLIDLQQARGVASHFNHGTPFDAAVSAAMTVLIVAASLILVEVTIRSFGAVALAPDDALAARWGMVLLVVGCALGGLITVAGERSLAVGRPPELYGSQGVLKFPHGLPLHAIQVLFIEVRALRWLRVPLRGRRWSLVATTAAFFALTIYGVLQTGLGAPRFPPRGLAWGAFVASAAAFAAAIAAPVVARRGGRNLSSPDAR